MNLIKKCWGYLLLIAIFPWCYSPQEPVVKPVKHRAVKRVVVARERAVEVVKTNPEPPKTAPCSFGEMIAKYFPESEWSIACRVMNFESRNNPNAHNLNHRTLDDSWGLFQVNRYGALAKTRPSAEWLVIPENNIQYAAQLYKSSGWQPWANTCRKVNCTR